MKYEYHKTICEILNDYLQENYPNGCRKGTIEKATYKIYDYTEGAYFSSDCSKVPMTMINGSIEFSPSYDELLNLDFILFICGNEIKIEAFEVEDIADSTGCGDTYMAAYIIKLSLIHISEPTRH